MKRIVMILLTFIMVFQLCMTPVYADANDYRKQFIEIKKSQSITDIDTNALSMDDLRFLALFISNFYMPWSTAFDDEDELGIKEKIVNTLTETCNFDGDIAEVLVDSIYKASLETAKPLYFCSDDELGMRAVIESMDTSTNLNAYKSSGNVTAAKIIQSTGDGSTQLPDNTYKMTYGMFLSLVRNHAKVESFWSDSNEPAYDEGRVAFGTNAHVVNAYGLYNSNLNYKNGIGSGFLTVDADVADTIRSEAVHQVLTPLAPLYVDWVGNIIVDDGVNRVVILPACLNPYSFKVIGGKDGARLNLISLLGFSEYGKGHIVLSKEASDTGTDDIDGSKERYKTAVYGGTQSLFNLEQWRPYRGNSGTSILDSDCWVGTSEGDKQLREVIGQYFEIRALSNIIGFPNWQSRLSGEAVSGEYYFTKQTSMAHVDYVWLDSLKEYEWDENEVSEYFHVTDLATETPDSSYSVSFSDVTDFGGITSLTKADDATLSKIYFTYLFAYANYQTGAVSFDKNKHLVNMMFNGDLFPKSHDNNIDWGVLAEKQAEKASDERSQEVMSMIYYILHPKEGMRYVSVWAKNKISAVLLGWHEDMVGATSSNTSTGMTKYIGFTGYTTIPALEDMEWTDWMLENYNSFIVYLIIMIMVILCCYIIVGSLTIQRAVGGMFIFAVLAFLPPVAINASVGVINWTCDTIYGNKFVYWALVQHQSYLQDLYAVKSGSAEDYKDFVLGVQVGYAGADKGENGEAAEQTNNNYAPVRLKWISPKKDNYMASFVEDMENLGEEDGEENSTVLTSNFGQGIISDKTSGQEFLESPDALFLYRDYMNITMYSLKSYNLYSTYYGGMGKGSNLADYVNGDYKLQAGTHWTGGRSNKNITYSSGVPFQNGVYANYEVSGGIYQSPKEWKELSSVSAIRRGFLVNTFEKVNGSDVDSSLDYYTKHNMAVNYLLNYPKAYADIHTSLEKLESDVENENVSIGKDRLKGYGLPQNYFNFTQTDLSVDEGEKYSKDSLDYYYYGLYSESPYYFFTFNVLDQMNAQTGYVYSDKEGISENFKNLFLGENLDYFYNYSPNAGDGYGELRDFMNMHDLFYYVIPLMAEGNQLVHEFDDAFGMKLYDDIKVRFTADGYVQVSQNGKTYQLIDVVAPDGTVIINEKVANDKEKGIKYRDLTKNWTEEEIYKFWHNYNVVTIFNAYSAWADTMYDCGYAEAETISVAGKKKVVENPLDPTCYYVTPVYARDKNGGIATDEKGNKKVDHFEYDGRPMVFSRSEMKYYGLEWNDLTKAEKKIIHVAENVYEKAIDLMNYYTFDDNVLISAYSMLQLFEWC